MGSRNRPNEWRPLSETALYLVENGRHIYIESVNALLFTPSGFSEAKMLCPEQETRMVKTWAGNTESQCRNR